MKVSTLPLPLMACLLLAGCASNPPSAVTASPLVGTYRVVSYQILPDGEPAVDAWGKQPRGYIVITPQRFMAVLTAQERKLPAGPMPTPQDFVNSFVTQIAYTGPYRIDGNRLVTTVDASSAATWVGTEQPREFKVEGHRLHLYTLHGRLPGTLPQHGGKPGRLHLVWEKVE